MLFGVLSILVAGVSGQYCSTSIDCYTGLFCSAYSGTCEDCYTCSFGSPVESYCSTAGCDVLYGYYSGWGYYTSAWVEDVEDAITTIIIAAVASLIVCIALIVAACGGCVSCCCSAKPAGQPVVSAVALETQQGTMQPQQAMMQQGYPQQGMPMMQGYPQQEGMPMMQQDTLPAI